MLLFAATSVAGDTIVRFDDPDEELHRPAAFNKAVGALPIDPRDGAQVRVWFFAYWSGEIKVRGFIVTRKGTWRCSLSYKHRAEDIAVHSGGTCSGPRMHPERIDQVMAMMNDVAKLDRNGPVCPVMDGGGANVEGIFQGKRFVFESANTFDCKDTNKDAALVTEFLDRVGSAYDNKDADEE